MECASYCWITLTVCLPPLTHQKLFSTTRPSSQTLQYLTPAIYLTDINFSENVIIKELSPNSAAGPDGMPSSLLINCASGIAPLL